MLMHWTAAKIPQYFCFSWFWLPMTVHFVFAAHIYVHIKKSHIPFHVHFFWSKFSFWCNELANFNHWYGWLRNMWIKSSAYLLNHFSPQLAPLSDDCCNKYKSKQYRGCWCTLHLLFLAFWLRSVLAWFTSYFFSSESHSSVAVYEIPV